MNGVSPFSTSTAASVIEAAGPMAPTLPVGISLMTEHPLPMAAVPVAALPETVSLALYGADGSGVATTPLWQAEAVGLGRSIIELGDDYALGFNTIAKEVVLANRRTMETTRIFGDARLETGTGAPLQFWGTTSFELENGILITANTIQSVENAQVYLLDKLTVSGDTRTLVIAGLAVAPPPVEAAPPPPLAVTSYTGKAADTMEFTTRDGLVLEESADGPGWRNEWTDDLVTQIDLDETAPGGIFAPDSLTMSLSEFSGFISRVMTTNFAINMASTLRQTQTDIARDSRNDDSASRRDRLSDLRRLVTMQSVLHLAERPSLNDQILQEALAA